MFNPDEIGRWRDALAIAPDLTEFEGHHFETRLLDVPARPLARPPLAPAGLLYPPDRVFGAPVEPVCLDGVGRWEVHAPTPEIARHENARVVGFTAVLADDVLYAPDDIRQLAPSEFLALNALGHHGFLAEAAGDRLAVRFAARPAPRRINRSALFFHNIEPGNYGSFVFRQLPQMIHARDCGATFDCYIVGDRTPWFLEALAILGLPRKPVYTVREVAGEVFRSIQMCNDLDTEGFMSPATRAGIARMADAAAGDAGEAGGSERIYVSRSLSSLARPAYRPMSNEIEIEKLVRRRGFKVVHPETLSLADQLRIFRSARHMIGPSGSGMFNTAFSNVADARVVDVETYSVAVRQHAKLYASTGRRYAFLFETPAADAGRPASLRRWRLAPERLDEAVDWLVS